MFSDKQQGGTVYFAKIHVPFKISDMISDQNIGKLFTFLLYDLPVVFLIPVRKSDSGAFLGVRFGGVSAVKPSGFRLTKTQLAVRRSGPRLSNNYCVQARCMAILLRFTGHFHQIFTSSSPH